MSEQPQALPSGVISGDTLALALGDNEAHARRVGIAYLLLLLGGMFGAHRFYVGKRGTAITQLVLTLLVFTAIITVIWVIVDVFLLAGYVTTFNLQLRATLLSRYGVLQADQISNYVSANVQKATSDFSLQSREVGTAYLLMLAGGVGGLFGAHRFYLGHRGVGAAQAILTISVVGLIVSVPWVIVDAFLVAGLVVGYNDNVKRHVAMENGIPVTA